MSVILLLFERKDNIFAQTMFVENRLSHKKGKIPCTCPCGSEAPISLSSVIVSLTESYVLLRYIKRP